MIGLVDCNNFFASCERVFNPALRGRPIVVLSNNDGCVIARSQEAKQLGIRMGVPFYQVKELMKKEQVAVFSSNYTLYGDLSGRVMAILAEQVPAIDVYSIDEAFVDLTGIPHLAEFGRKLVRTTARSSGIPVCLGVAPTRTLAKLANHFAKKYPGYQRVCLIDSEEKRMKALQKTPVEEVWGIGRRMAQSLHAAGVQTAYQLTQKSRSWVRRKLTVVGERTWRELQGEPCIGSDSVVEKQQICTSRSFGSTVSDFETLREAVSNFTVAGAAKLRKQDSLAQGLLVFAYTNRHRSDLQQYYPSKLVRLSYPTSDTTELVKHACQALHEMYRSGYAYKKAGVILTDLCRAKHYVPDLFDGRDLGKQQKIAAVIDQINQKNGGNSIKLASQGLQASSWNLRRDYLSKCPSTKLSDIIEVKV